MFIRLVQDFGLESEVAKHLAHTYGDRAFSVAKLANMTGKRWPIGEDIAPIILVYLILPPVHYKSLAL